VLDLPEQRSAKPNQRGLRLLHSGLEHRVAVPPELDEAGVVLDRLLPVPAAQGFCVEGLNFFLVVQESGRGYWVGPFQPERSAHVDLMIEKYAGLSSAYLTREPR